MADEGKAVLPEELAPLEGYLEQHALAPCVNNRHLSDHPGGSTLKLLRLGLARFVDKLLKDSADVREFLIGFLKLVDELLAL